MTVPLWLHAAAWWCVIASTFAVWWIEGVSGASPFVRGWVRGTLIGYLTVALALLFVGACQPAHSAERRTTTVKEVSHEGLHEGVASGEGWNEGTSTVRQEASGRKAVEGQPEERGWVGRDSSVSGVQGGPRSAADGAVLAGGVTLRWTAPTVDTLTYEQCRCLCRPINYGVVKSKRRAGRFYWDVLTDRFFVFDSSSGPAIGDSLMLCPHMMRRGRPAR